MSSLRQETLGQVDAILEEYRATLSNAFAGYRNHVARVVAFGSAQRKLSGEQFSKFSVAACFHDIGIWTAGTFDYLEPSVEEARKYLRGRGLDAWTADIERMILNHHKLRAFPSDDLTEVFRRSDLIDFSLGFIRCGVDRERIREVKRLYPNAGFHKGLVRMAARWIGSHPLRPVPVVKW